MSSWAAWITAPHIAGVVAVLVGVLDDWAFRASFGLSWDQALIVGGLAWLGGSAVTWATTSAQARAVLK